MALLIWGTAAVAPTAAQWRFSPDGNSQGAWGFVLGHQETSRLGREAAVAKYNYCPTGGCLVRIETVEVQPDITKKGGTLHLTTTYTILTADGVSIPVVTSREIFFKGQSLGKTKDIATRRDNGTWKQEIDFALPENVAPGLYTLVTKINTGYGGDQRLVQFLVQ